MENCLGNCVSHILAYNRISSSNQVKREALRAFTKVSGTFPAKMFFQEKKKNNKKSCTDWLSPLEGVQVFVYVSYVILNILVKVKYCLTLDPSGSRVIFLNYGFTRQNVN